ncbi:unnamed protein product [Discula destructiva]
MGADYNAVDKQMFKERFFDAEKPLLMKASPLFVRSPAAMPAVTKWFGSKITAQSEIGLKKRHTMSAYLRSFSDTILPYELAYPQPRLIKSDPETVQQFIESLDAEDSSEAGSDMSPTHFAFESKKQLGPLIKDMLPLGYSDSNPTRRQHILRFHAPLALLEAAIDFNLKRPNAGMRKLYVAQAPLNDLPQQLQDDLPVPDIVKLAGKGDIYNSSIWLGLEPIYTPLHRDPNPNLFIQLRGKKLIRLLPPASGSQLYRDVLLRVGAGQSGNPRIRGPEMMDGPETELLRKAVWDNGGLRAVRAPKDVPIAHQDLSRTQMRGAFLQPGDALFIPKGWWHSVISIGKEGALNASVNWWFR